MRSPFPSSNEDPAGQYFGVRTKPLAAGGCGSVGAAALTGATIGMMIVGFPGAIAGRVLDTVLAAVFCCNSGLCGEVAGSPLGISSAAGSADLGCRGNPCTSFFAMTTGLPGAVIGAPVGAAVGCCMK